MFFFFVPIAQRQSGHFCFSPACLKSHRLSIAQASLALRSAQAFFDMLIQKETKRNKMLSLVG